LCTPAAIKEAKAEVKTCRAEVRERSKYENLISHYPALDTNQYSIEQLSDDNIPTTEEARLVAYLYDDAEACRSIFAKAIAENRPDAIAILEDAQNKNAEITIKLVKRKLTWGEAARQYKALNAELDAKLATADQQWRGNLDASNNAEMEQRRAAAGVALLYLQNQQMLNQQQLLNQQQNYNQQMMVNSTNRPITTNCLSSGSMLSCTSQ
jgi:hypothetical protein